VVTVLEPRVAVVAGFGLEFFGYWVKYWVFGATLVDLEVCYDRCVVADRERAGRAQFTVQEFTGLHLELG